MDSSVAPLVSVVLPVYNSAAYLEEAVHSIRSQTYTSFELIVINDGSTDTSGSILNRHASEDSRITLVHHTQNQGLIATLNEGFALAKGWYIARMDADDISLPYRLEHQVRYLETHPECFCVGGWYKHYPGGKLQKLATTDPQIKVDVLNYNPMAHPVVMMRRAEWLHFGLAYEPMHKHVEDLALWLTCMKKGLAFANLSEVLLLYRRHSGQVSEVFQRPQEQAVLTLRAAYLAGILGMDEHEQEVGHWLDRSIAPKGSLLHSFLHVTKAIENYANQLPELYRTAWLRFLSKHYLEKIRMLPVSEKKACGKQLLEHAPCSMTRVSRARLWLWCRG